MLTILVSFGLGVFLAPVVRPLLRPIIVEIIRAGLTIAAETRRLSAQVKEGMEDVAAEANAQRAAAKVQSPASAQPTAPPSPDVQAPSPPPPTV